MADDIYGNARLAIASETAEEERKATLIKKLVAEALADEKKVAGLTSEEFAIAKAIVEKEKADKNAEIQEIDELITSITEQIEFEPYQRRFDEIMKTVNETRRKEEDAVALKNIKAVVASYKE